MGKGRTKISAKPSETDIEALTRQLSAEEGLILEEGPESVQAEKVPIISANEGEEEINYVRFRESIILHFNSRDWYEKGNLKNKSIIGMFVDKAGTIRVVFSEKAQLYIGSHMWSVLLTEKDKKFHDEEVAKLKAL